MNAIIRTDHRERFFRDRAEVPAKVLASDFDHLTEEDGDSFVLYRGEWLHLSAFEALAETSPLRLLGWDGIRSDSFFSGVLISVSRDCESYRIGTLLS